MEASNTTVPSIVVYVTVPNKEAGTKLAGSIIKERLAASVNRVPENDSKNEEIAPKKRSNGRRKIPIEMIADKTRKHVTFSKRRSGLFKKASELCALCGVEMALLTFFERGKLFCFGHPNPDDIIRRYVSSQTLDDAEDDVKSDGLALMMEEHNRRCEEIRVKIEEEKKFADFQVIRQQGQNWNIGGKSCGFWWDEAPIHEMGLDELEQFMTCLLEVRNNAAKQVDIPTRANPSFQYNHMVGDITVDQFCSDNNQLGSNNMMMVGEDANGKMDILDQGFGFGFDYVDMEDRSGKELSRFSNVFQGMESFDLNVMNQHHNLHEETKMEEKSSLAWKVADQIEKERER